MKSQWGRLLAVSFLLVCGIIGCREKPRLVGEPRDTTASEPKPGAVESKVVDEPKATSRETKAVGKGPVGKPDAVEKQRPVLDEAVAAQREHSQRLRLPIRLTNSIGMKLTLIPAGEFTMGSPEPGGDVPIWEKPQHEVRITKPFYLSVCEVTQAEYQKVMGENPSYFKGAGNPADQASWNDAVVFCRRLSAKEGKTYRLPTEAEWEYACRAGTETRYSSGDDLASLERYAWYQSSKTYPAGTRRPNAWGLCDMHGNVAEWCADRWDENFYTVSSAVDPRGPEIGSLRVIRGGGWKDDAGACRAANRGGFVPGGRMHHLGFRVAADTSGFENDVLPAKPARQPPRRR